MMLLGAITVSAQHVVPIEEPIEQLSFDSLRAQYADNTSGYLSELLHIEALQEAGTEMLKRAKKQLNEEKAHAKDMDKCMKQARKTLQQLDKSIDKQEDILNGMHTTIERQVRSTMRYALLSKENRDAYEQMLNGERLSINTMLTQLREHQKNVQLTLNDIQRVEEALADFVLEIKQKELDIKQHEQVQKMNQQALKSEIKAVRALINSKK